VGPTKQDDRGEANAPLTRILCARRHQPVDIELCFSCGLPCAAAQPVSGRPPDRDAAWLRLVAQSGIAIV
jgi:hypothetical protein